ncbi:protein of unknown function [Friedmanniella luteola]|uniref:DUF4439 domain-containing protein n=1 Tax=Friedmanniella luteola TaxID=546871 RepID=A0A1H1Q3N4_9ACTN|nr:DUF4439 domain-containing protein [Friedmanniella luteola]SDS17943.1 protein of unknown function [Friedmanniella luteola]
MPDPIPAPAPGRERWSRRTLLLGGLAVGASACSVSDPAVRGPAGAPAATARPSPTPSPLAPGLARDVAAETALAAGARAQRARTDADDARRRDLLGLVEQAHTARAAAITAPDPAEPTPSSTSTPAPGPRSGPGRAPGTERLVADERALAARYRAAAMAAGGPAALLWGSMAVASGAFATALAAAEPPRSAAVADRAPLTVPSDSAAVSALVGSLHAAVWGYQLALGKLPVTGARHDRARAGLRERRALQARLVDRLRRAGVEVPAAAPAYDPDPEVRDADDARLLLRRIETRLLPFCGLWLAAAARPADRAAALAALTATATTATAWGAPLQAWPGWSA